jgi:hypothetical protein
MAESIPVSGVLVREGEMTGDGRTFANGSIRWGSDVLPIPIIFDREEGDHSGATVGYIDTVWRDGDDIRGQGWLSNSDDPHTQALVARAAELITEGAVGVSVGVDQHRGGATIDLGLWDDVEEQDGKITIPVNYDDVAVTFTEARLRHLAIVDTPAFSTASLEVVPDLTGVLVASAGIASDHYFDNPKFGAPGVDDRLRYDPGAGKWSCPPTINGQHYFGHVAPQGVCLRGQPGRCVNPPDGDLEGFMRGYAPAAGGRRTGVVVLGGSHSDLGIGVVEASKHYDKTGRGVADVRVGVDAYGVWFSGMLRPGISDNDRYALAASDVSGHWELDQRGRSTLVGLPAVNVGGFPKGYLTAAEVAAGIAASAQIEQVTHTDDCGCGAIDLATVLAFQDR